MIKNASGIQTKLIKYLFLCVYLYFLFYLTGWPTLSKQIPIDLDELAWVHDSQVFEWRSNKDLSKFSWSKNENLSWMSHDFRLFDQPHFVKYIYGYILTKNNLKPWSDLEQQRENYLQFTQQSLSGKHLLSENSSSNLFGKNTTESIILSRSVSSFFGILFVTLLAIFLTKEFSIYQAMAVSFLIVTHPTFQYNLNLATADSISMFFILISLILFYYFYKNKKYESYLLFFSSISTAFAASSKINGWILLPIYLLLVLIKENDDKKIINKILTWLSLFMGVYFYLQPELWSHPLFGLTKYFSQRLTQQIRFELHNQSYNFFNYHYWLIELFLKSQNKFLFFIKGIILILSSFFALKKRTSIYNNLKSKWLILLIIFLPWITLFSYAKVGYERYAMWPLLILFVTSSNFSEKFLRQFFDKIYSFYQLKLQ